MKFNIKSEDIIQRILEIIPGGLIWLLLASPLIGGILFPNQMVLFYILLTLYLFYKSILIILGIVIGYIKYRFSLKKNWLLECNNLGREDLPDINSLPEGSKLPKHLIVIANYGEDYNVIYRTIKAITEQNYPRELIYIAFSIEERKAEIDREYSRREFYLRRDFSEFFNNRLFFFIHPKDLGGEVAGAASNRTWGARNAVELLEKEGQCIKEFLITAPDGDTVLHTDYLANVTYKWLTTKDRNNKFYQPAVYTYNNNYWNVPTLIRILSMDITLQILGSSIFEYKAKETFSCYTLNLELLKKVNYWDVSLPIDDSLFYWRVFDYLDGNWRCEIVFSPIHNDAVYSESYLLNYIKQYQQYLRWGFGVISFPMAIKILFENHRVRIRQRIFKIINLFETYILLRIIIFLVVLGPFFLLLINPSIDLSHFKLISFTTSITAIFVIIYVLASIILSPRSNKRSLLHIIFMTFIEMPLNLFAILTLGTIPFVDAATRVMFGDRRCRSIQWTEKKFTFEQPI